MSMRSLVVWGAGGVTLAAAAIAFWLILTGPTSPAPWGPPGTLIGIVNRWVAASLSLVIAPVGLLILVRRPGNRIGWVALALAFDLATLQALDQVVGDQFSKLGPALSVAANLGFVAFPALLLSVLLLYPDGRLPSRRWRPLGRAIVAWVVLTAGSTMAATTFYIGQKGSGGTGANPTGGVPGPIGDLAAFALPVLTDVGEPALLLAVVSAVIVRFVRSRGVERQQLKWFAYAAFLNLLTFVAAGANQGPVSILANNLVLDGMPVAIAIAVLRYRLYDIDLLINRTVVYGATSGAIALTFYVGIVALQGLLRPITSGSELAVAASTLVSFALFQPIRRGVQDAIDRRFDRSRYDAARTADTFADRLRDEVDLDAVRADLIHAAHQTMAPAHASLWLRERVT